MAGKSVNDFINEGHSAFPARVNEYVSAGMTLRDYSAAKAMQSGCQSFDNMSMENIEESIPTIAKISYAVADAMLAERAK